MDNHFFQTMGHSCFRRILSDDLGRVGSRFAGTAKIHLSRTRPRNSVSLGIGNRDDRIVECRAHLGNASGDILAPLSFADLQLADLFFE